MPCQIPKLFQFSMRPLNGLLAGRLQAISMASPKFILDLHDMPNAKSPYMNIHEYKDAWLAGGTTPGSVKYTMNTALGTRLTVTGLRPKSAFFQV